MRDQHRKARGRGAAQGDAVAAMARPSPSSVAVKKPSIARKKAATKMNAARSVRGAIPSATGAPRADRDEAAIEKLARFLTTDFWRPRGKRHDWIGQVFESEPMVRMRLVREGVPAQAVPSLAEALGMSREQLTRELGFARATVERKLKSGGRLGTAESESVLGVARLIGQVQQIVEQSGDPADFDAAAWVAQWLETSLPALAGHAPIEFMDTAEGRDIVSGLVAQMQSGAYA